MTIDDSTGDQSVSVKPVPGEGGVAERIRRFNRDVKARAAASVSPRGGAVQALDAIYIPGLITPVQTDGAFGGVNYHMVNANASGLLIMIQPYQNMSEGDWIKVFWGDDSTPVASDGVLPEHVGESFSMFVAASLIPEGVNELYATVTRSGGGNEEQTTPVAILVRTELPGGTDPEPDAPGHQNLLPPEPELPPSGIIDEEAAKNGIKVTIVGYPNMRQFDVVSLYWGGELVAHQVTQQDVDAGSLDILVTEEVILAAGDSDQLVLVYRVVDEVHNQSTDWSMRTYVAVEIGEGLFDGPLVENPDQGADPYDVIDLEELGEDDLQVSVMVISGSGMAKGDVVALKWVGSTAQGQPITVEPEPLPVPVVPTILTFQIPNADVRGLAHGRGVASYTVTRDGGPLGVSKRTFVSFVGVEQGLPKPTVSDTVDGVLDPALAGVVVTVPGEVLEAGDYVYLTWLGTRSNGSPLLEVFERPVSGGTAGKPMVFEIDGAKLIAPLDGGSVAVYYRLYKSSIDQEMESGRELLMVGEAVSELPAPFTRPPSDSGVLDPEELTGFLQVVVAPYPGMKAGQTVYLVWRASSGPQHDDFMPISPPMEGKEVVFYLDKALVEQYLGADIEVSYRVEEDGEPSRGSSVSKFSVGPKEDALPLPVVVEANGDVLNPGDALEGATVRIPVEAGLKHGDEVEVTWQGDKPGGVTSVNDYVEPEHVGKPFDLIVDYAFVVANADGNVAVSYTVFRQAGGAPTSGTLNLRVQSALLPLAQILEAEGDELNPDDVLQGATVRIDASAQFKGGDQVIVRVISSATGGSTSIPYSVPPGGAGQPVLVTVPYNVINASNGVEIDLMYEISRAAGGPVEESETVTYRVSREVGSGPLRVMGARFNLSTYRASSAPRMLSALHDTTLAPLLAEWRYEGDSQWTARTQWFDNKPWLKLHVRSKTQTWVCEPANIIGNGIDTNAIGGAAFVAMRDEVVVGSEKEVDMVAWGNEDYGGKLHPHLITVKNVVEISGTSNAFAARLRDGYVVCWGGDMTAPSNNGDFVQVRSNAMAFVGRKSDGSLFAWGSEDSGVPVTPEVAQYKDYVHVCGAATAFAALRANGRVVAWGDPDNGGKLLDGQEVFSDIVQVLGNYGAFAAMRDGGGSKSVIAWGNKAYAGEVTPEIAQLTNVKALGAASSQAFTVLLDSGGVRAWGPESHGGVVPDIIEAMTNVVEVSSTWHAFCARLSNGHVVAWGNENNGGKVPEPIARLSNIVQVVGSAWSFAALCRDGTVVAWGDKTTGGDTSPVLAQLVDVRAIYANSHGFTALTKDGRVVTWGEPNGGGNSDEVQDDLRGKVTPGRFVDAG